MDRRIYTDELAALIVADGGGLYRPSNGTEGNMFMDLWCNYCKREIAYQEERDPPCAIMLGTFVFDVRDPEYPKEWCYTEDGQPCCTAFEQVED